MKGTNSVGTAYILWLGCLLQLHGLHRLYNGKIFTGLLWMCSFGLFGFGQLVDLLLIPHMVDEHNTKVKSQYGLSPAGVPLIQPEIQNVQWQLGFQEQDALMVQLLRAAESRGGKLSVNQAVLETGASFADVEVAFRQMVYVGYVDASDDALRGIVVNEFRPQGDRLMLQLLKAAVARDGKLSVTQGVLDTGADFTEVEATLKEMVRTGYVDVGNDPDSGVIFYEFREL
jgi:TM2 domain-containing membrane protein YozV